MSIAANIIAAPAPAAPAPEAAPATPTAPVAGATAPEAPVTPPAAPTPPEDPRMAAKFAALTRKEQAAVQAAAAAKADREAAERARAEAKAVEDKWGGYKGKPEKALEALKELGYTYEQITQLYLNGGQPTPEMTAQQLSERIDAMEAQRVKDADDARQAAINQAKEAEEAAVTEFKASIETHVSDKAVYPLINHFGQRDQVWGLIDGHYAKTGQLLTIPDASKMVEDYIRDQVTQSQALIAPPQVTPAPETAAQEKRSPFSPVSKPASTLTPSSAPVTSSTKPKAYKSREEEINAIVAKYSRK